MFEPLLQVTIPDEQVFQIQGPVRLPQGPTRKVIVIGEIWVKSWAERNTAAIVKQLLETGKVQVIALGDYSEETQRQFPRPGLELSAEDLQQRLRRAEEDLLAGRSRVVEYLGLAAPITVPLIGANREDLLAKAREGRDKRGVALDRLYRLADRLRGTEAHGSGETAPDVSTVAPFAGDQPSATELVSLVHRLASEDLGIDLAAAPGPELLAQLPVLLEKFGLRCEGVDLSLDIDESIVQLLKQGLVGGPNLTLASDLAEQLEKALGGTITTLLAVGPEPPIEAPRIAWEGELGFTLTEEPGSPPLAELPALISTWLNAVSTPTPPDRAIPILERLRDRLAAVKQMSPDSPVHMIEQLFRKVSESMDHHLPALMQFAKRRGMDPDLYPHLQAACRVLEANRFNLHRVRREQRWLVECVMSRLMGARIDPHGGLRAVFDMELRRIFHTGEDRIGLLGSSQPLHKCARAAVSRLMMAVGNAVERNEEAGIVAARELLDLASLLQLDDLHYMVFRAYINSRAGFSPSGVLADLDGLKGDLVTVLSVDHPLDSKLYQLGEDIDDLDNLLRESLSAAAAERILTRLPTGGAIAHRLETLGERFSGAEKEQLEVLDEECIPPALAFYESSQEQASVMADRVLRAMSQYEADAAVLICGSYHPHAVVRELSASQQVACSSIIPQMDGKKPHGRQISLEQIREAAKMSPEINVVRMGKDRLRELARKHLRKDAPSGEAELPDDPDNDWLGSLKSPPDVRAWVERNRGATVFVEAITQVNAELSGELVNECRVCHRQVPTLLDTDSLACPRHGAPLFVLQCPRCHDRERGSFGYLCIRCAGRIPAAYVPGHGRGDALRCGQFAETVVCNIHGVPLVSQPHQQPGGSAAPPAQPASDDRPDSRRRRIGGSLPGHSWFG